jgi:hypothetical protein
MLKIRNIKKKEDSNNKLGDQIYLGKWIGGAEGLYATRRRDMIFFAER